MWHEALPELQQHFIPFGLDILLVDVHQGADVDIAYNTRTFQMLLKDIDKSSANNIGPFFLARQFLFQSLTTAHRALD